MTELHGRIIKGVGGLYDVRLTDGGVRDVISCRAKGILRRGDEKLYVGDLVTVTSDKDTPDGIVIASCLPRKNCLIRPPLSNLDFLLIVLSPANPAPVLSTVDKLTAIAEHNGITPVIVITKADIDRGEAERIAGIYRSAGFTAFVTSSSDGTGTEQLHKYTEENIKDGRCAAFAGASGVGKSTLMNRLFPSLSLATSDISRRIGRGRHTTRHVELYDITDDPVHTGFLADTPGFSLIDFERFDFFSLDDLLPAFRDIMPYTGHCRYSDCAHVGEGEDECAVARAAKEGRIAESRLSSYREIYKILKAKRDGFR